MRREFVKMNTSYSQLFEPKIQTTLLKNITNSTRHHGLEYAMFKAIWHEDLLYSCERICIEGKNGLQFQVGEESRLEGFDIEAEDPRMVKVRGVIYVVFICNSIYPGQKKCIAITRFDKFKPIFLRIEDYKPNYIEKNWAPFEKDGDLYFVYNYGPLIVIKYDFNSQGICQVTHLEAGTSLPINTNEPNFLRGGSNLLPFLDHFYIGGCHSRIFEKCFYHFTHFVILDTRNWRIRFLSKPVLYRYPHQDLGVIPETDILFDLHPNCIQDPISLNYVNNKYLLSINVRDAVSLLYQIDFDLDVKDFQIYEKGSLQALTKTSNEDLVQSVIIDEKISWIKKFLNKFLGNE